MERKNLRPRSQAADGPCVALEGRCGGLTLSHPDGCGFLLFHGDGLWAWGVQLSSRVLCVQSPVWGGRKRERKGDKIVKVWIQYDVTNFNNKQPISVLRIGL